MTQWQQWLTIFGAVLAIFGVMGAGMVLRRLKLLTREADTTLLKVVINLLMPCLILDVIIGNPPYNANQQNENDNNKNRTYPHIDMAETGERVAGILERIAAEGRPAKAFRQLDFLIPINWQCTMIEPAATDTALWDHLDPDSRDDLPAAQACRRK